MRMWMFEVGMAVRWETTTISSRHTQAVDLSVIRRPHHYDSCENEALR